MPPLPPLPFCALLIFLRRERVKAGGRGEGERDRGRRGRRKEGSKEVKMTQTQETEGSILSSGGGQAWEQTVSRLECLLGL